MKPFTAVAVVVFAIVAALHLCRLLLGWQVTINGWPVPLWFSGCGFLAAGALAFLVWREHRG